MGDAQYPAYELSQRIYNFVHCSETGLALANSYDVAVQSCQQLQSLYPEKVREEAERWQRTRSDALSEREHTPFKHLGGTDEERIDEIRRLAEVADRCERVISWLTNAGVPAPAQPTTQSGGANTKPVRFTSAVLKPRAADGPIEAVEIGTRVKALLPLEGGGRLAFEMARDDALLLAEKLISICR